VLPNCCAVSELPLPLTCPTALSRAPSKAAPCSCRPPSATQAASLGSPPGVAAVTKRSSSSALPPPEDAPPLPPAGPLLRRPPPLRAACWRRALRKAAGRNSWPSSSGPCCSAASVAAATRPPGTWGRFRPGPRKRGAQQASSAAARASAARQKSQGPSGPSHSRTQAGGTVPASRAAPQAWSRQRRGHRGRRRVNCVQINVTFVWDHGEARIGR
jgi:hypothetical protein